MGYNIDDDAERMMPMTMVMTTTMRMTTTKPWCKQKSASEKYEAYAADEDEHEDDDGGDGRR